MNRTPHIQPVRFDPYALLLLLPLAIGIAGCESSTSLESGGAGDCASDYLEANAPLRLVMPFAEGSRWTVGDRGSFFGEFAHNNNVRDRQGDGEFFATDWNCCGAGNADDGEPVYPIAPGRVTVAQADEVNYGNNVIVVHPGNPPFRSRYAHLKEIMVEANDIVFTTTQIGTVGNSGTNSAHLHLVFQRWSERWQHWRSKSSYPNANDTESRKLSPMWTAGGSTELCNAATLTAAKGVSVFQDVNPGDDISRYITSVYAHGYAIGCNNEPYEFCPFDALTRAEMAVIIVRSVYGPDYEPAQPQNQLFDDVSLDKWYAKWINRVWLDKYVVGCSLDPPLYCPDRHLNRAELAVLVVRARLGPDYKPPSAGGLFVDMPPSYWGAKWGEAAFREGIMGPCDDDFPLRFCPEEAAYRAEMAKALAKAKRLMVPAKP